MLGQRCKVCGIVIHVVAVAGLARPPMAAAVMGDDPIAVMQKEQHLCIPIVGGQGPAMAKYDGLAGAPILVENLDAIRSSERAHAPVSSLGVRAPYVWYTATRVTGSQSLLEFAKLAKTFGEF